MCRNNIGHVLVSFFFIALSGTLFSACAESGVPIEEGVQTTATSQERGGADQGTPILELPFARGTTHMCVQGAGGTYSHSYQSTRYDLDLDTGNGEDEAVFAPATGSAYIHGSVDDRDGFGLHVNIDLGDGSYATIAHLKKVFIKDGEQVVAGQLIGVEGCSGSCQGDHVHIGHHRGDSKMSAGHGISAPARYRVTDTTAGDEEVVLSASDFTCGIKSAGDPQDGHFYESHIKDVRTHPDGTLVKTPDSNKVYLIDNGRLRWMKNESVFHSYNYRFSEVVNISRKEAECYERGSDIDELTTVRAAYHQDTGELWLLTGADGLAKRQRVDERFKAAVLDSWGLQNSPSHPPTLAGDDSFFSHPPTSGWANLRDGTLVTERSSSDVYAVVDGVAVPIVDWSTFLRLGFAGRSVVVVDDGGVRELQHDVGSCLVGDTCIDFVSVKSCGSKINLAGFQQSDSDRESESPDNNETPQEGEADNSQSGNVGNTTFNLHYYPSEDLAVHSLSVFGRARDAADSTVIQWQELVSERYGNDLAWGTDTLEPGGFARFAIRANDVDSWFLTCEQVKEYGSFIALFQGQIVGVDYVSPDEGDGCRLDIRLPVVDDGQSSGSNDEGQTQSGGSDNGDSGDSGSGSTDEPAQRTLELEWSTPFLQSVPRITLSGEYVLENGNFGFPWNTLKTVNGTDTLIYQLSGVQSGDHLRFSVEFEDANGDLSWSCIHDPGPPEGYIPQGALTVRVDGQTIATQMVGDPRSNITGCGFRVTIP